MKVCILGGGGCFGLNTASHFLKNSEVIGIGRSPLKKAFTLNVGGYRYHQLHLVYELDYVMELLDSEKPELIVNYAAQGEGQASFNPKDNWRFYQTNTLAMARLVGQLYKRDWLKRFIHIGTSEVYGSVSKPSKESDPVSPTSPYAVSKLAFDLHLGSLFRIQGFPMNVIRPSNGYGPGQQLHRIIPKAVISALRRKKLPLHGGGLAEKSYLHMDDISKAVEAVWVHGVVGKTYNVGPFGPTSIRNVVSMCAEACGTDLESLVEVTEDRLGQDSKYWLDSSEVAKDTGWTQTIGIKKGIQTVVEWVKKNPELLEMESTYRLRS